MRSNTSLYVVSAESQNSNDVLAGIEILAFLTPEQAWGEGNGNEVIFAFEDRAGEMIPVEFLLKELRVIRLV